MCIGIAPGLIDHLVAAAAAEPALEICGLLLGTFRRIDAVQPTRNVADDPAISFEIDPGALFAALRREREGGPRVIGHYHSHPNGSTDPSPRDLAAAEPGKLWLIIGGGDARLWRAEPSGFLPVQVIVNQDCASTVQSPEA